MKFVLQKSWFNKLYEKRVEDDVIKIRESSISLKPRWKYYYNCFQYNLILWEPETDYRSQRE